MTNSNNKFNIRTGFELVTSSVPEIPYRIIGLLRSNGGRLSLTGQYKSEKSLLAQEMAMRIAKGDDWLGFKTIPGNILYTNLEISKEKFHERTQEFFNSLGYDIGNLSRFNSMTILDRNLSIDLGTAILQEMLNVSKTKGFPVDTIILDPRARTVIKSENEEVTIKALCGNIDIILKNNPGLSIILVTHMGKDPTKGAIGHSRYSGWLDTEITIKKSPYLACNKELVIVGRDIERATLSLDFAYPLHNIVYIEEMARKTKVTSAKEYIITKLSGGEETEQQLKIEARRQSITDYAFNTAIRELKDEKQIEAIQSGQGNRKILRLIAESAQH